MPWVRIDEEFPDHPKVVGAGPLGIAMQVAGLCYCNRHLTDGFVPRSAARRLIDLDGLGVSPEDVISVLLGVGMWARVDGGYQIHDYDHYQPTREQVLAERERNRAAGQKGGLARAAKRGAKRTASGVLSEPSSDGQADRLAKPQAESKPVPVPVPPLGDPGVQVIPEAETDGVHPLVDPATPDRPGTLPTPSAIQEVWVAYLAARESVGLTGSVRLTPKRRDKIRTRLKAFPLADVIDAAWGWTRDPWPERRHHCDAVQVFKTDEHVEKFRDLWQHGPPHTAGKATQQAKATYLEMLGGDSGGVARVGPDRGQAQRKLSGPAG